MKRWHRRYQGVTAYTGQPGGGKTFSLVEIGLRALRSGRPVATNAGFEIECPLTGRRSDVYRSWEELMIVPAGYVVLLDEAPSFFNARRWQDFPDGLLWRFTQVRKDALEFHYSAIDLGMVDATLRRLTFWEWQCRAVLPPVMFRVLLPPPESRRARDKPRKRELYVMRKDVQAAYDTHAKVWVRRSLVEKVRNVSKDPWVPLDLSLQAGIYSHIDGLPAGDPSAGVGGREVPAEPQATRGGPPAGVALRSGRQPTAAVERLWGHPDALWNASAAELAAMVRKRRVAGVKD